jgi:hypothetical protein
MLLGGALERDVLSLVPGRHGEGRVRTGSACSRAQRKVGPTTRSNVENVHFDKNLGMAEITRESAEDFVKRHHPDKFEEFARTSATAESPCFYTSRTY